MLRKVILSIAILSVFTLLNPYKANAHPIDNTDNYFYIQNEVDGAQIDENQIKLYSYLNWFQAGMLVEAKEGVQPEDIYALAKYQTLYDAYVIKKIKVTNNGEVCKPTAIDSPILDEQFSLSLGTRSIINFDCPTKIENVKIENDLFNEFFDTESNIVEIYNSDKLLHKLTMTKDVKSYEFNYPDLLANPKGDESFDVSANLSTEQVVNELNEPKQQNFLSKWNDYLYLKANDLKNTSIFILCLVVFALGLLHTLEAGHSKAILASAMVNNKMSFKNGATYALIFTLTHLGDILILGALFLVADQFFDVYSKFSMLETFAAYALVLMALYIIFREITHLIQAKFGTYSFEHEHTHVPVELENGKKPSLKEQIILGFVAGLAPCIFGWSIFMLVVSTGNLWLLIPLILSFGAGIYATLIVVAYIFSKVRDTTFGKIDKIARYSPLASAILLLIYGVFILS